MSFHRAQNTANYQFQNLLPPLVGPKTAIVTLQNGFGHEEQLAKIFSVEQILAVFVLSA